MKVNQLIQGTVWKPGSGYELGKPIVSILLPTFRRAKSGLFQKAVRSVLDQTLKDLELIIIDDASTDGTSDQIAEYMAQDGRVSCLRHPINIGLPAVSEFEGYLKARGTYIAFQFDDDEFNLAAIQDLVNAAIRLEAQFVYGHVNFMTLHSDTGEREMIHEFGKLERPQETLQYANYISNNAVLLHRSVLEKVGLYDPNVAMARWCDYDLWRRCAQWYKLYNVDVSVGTVTGPATVDSLGNTYAMEKWASFEWMNLDRNEQLRPHNFGNVDVLGVPLSLAAVSKNALSEIHQLFSRRGWHRSRNSDGAMDTSNALGEGYVVLVVPHHQCLNIPLNEMASNPFQRVRLVNGYNSISQIEDEIIGASAIILVHELTNFSAWAECARSLRIPHYFYLDEAFNASATSNNLGGLELQFRAENLRNALTDFEGLIYSTIKLAQYFDELKLHRNAYVTRLPLKSLDATEVFAPIEIEASGGVSASFIAELLDKHPAAGLALREARYQTALRSLKLRVGHLKNELSDSQQGAARTMQSVAGIRQLPLVIAPMSKGASTFVTTKLRRYFQERTACEPSQYAHVLSAPTAFARMENEVVCQTLLSGRVFREYRIDISASPISAIRLPVAFEPRCARRAEFGIEILSPNHEIVFHEVQSLLQSYSDGVVSFDIASIMIAVTGWRLRIFVRSADTPVYLFERRPRSPFGRALQNPKLFFDLSVA